jgi:sodium pump decarboxylase gamma subunit
MDIVLIEEALLIMVVGLGGVFASLLMLMLMIAGMRAIDERLNARRIRTYTEKVESKQIDSDELNDEIVAAITAAVSTVLKPHVVVRRIRFLSTVPGEETWAVTGRTGIMTSHTVPKR